MGAAGTLCLGSQEFDAQSLPDSQLSFRQQNKYQAQPKMLLVKFRDMDNTRKCWLWDMEEKQRTKGTREYTNTIPRITHVFH